jgi:hypothetical protein
MKLSEARLLARKAADECNITIFVYQGPGDSYDVAFSIPDFGVQVDAYAPLIKYVPQERIRTQPGSSGSSNALRAEA